MNTPQTRRDFIKFFTAASSMILLPGTSLASLINTNAPVARFKFGYAASTWASQPEQAIKDISELGFKAIQLQADRINTGSNTADTLKETLKKYKLELPVLASNPIDIYSTDPGTILENQLRHAEFAKKVGAEYLQVFGAPHPGADIASNQDFIKLGKQLNNLGKRLQLDYGIKLAFSNHVHHLGATPQEIDKIMDVTDPAWVKLIFDTGHYRQTDANPILAIRKYRDRLVHLYLNDVVTSPSANGENANGASRNYQFVELGRGSVNFPAIFAALRDAQFKGWCIIKLDTLPTHTRTPRECAQISKNYISQQLKFKI
jgi:inosose dehydratase